MATVIEPRRLEDLEQNAVARIDQERQRRAGGLRPWSDEEYVNQVAKIHARYAAWRLALQKWSV